jgi:hypothetical protein
LLVHLMLASRLGMVIDVIAGHRTLPSQGEDAHKASPRRRMIRRGQYV